MSFKEITGETVVLSHGGVFRQADLYEWDGKLFAKHGTGYVRLKENGSTSKDGVNIEMLYFDGELRKDKFGRLRVTGGTPIAQDRTMQLTRER